MLSNGILWLITSVPVFVAGMFCGARLVHRYRHVTSKTVHQALLNSYAGRTEELDHLRRLLARSNAGIASEPAVETHSQQGRIHPLAAAMARSRKSASPFRPRLYRP